jgi:hypothetical protein
MKFVIVIQRDIVQVGRSARRSLPSHRVQCTNAILISKIYIAELIID